MTSPLRFFAVIMAIGSGLYSFSDAFAAHTLGAPAGLIVFDCALGALQLVLGVQMYRGSWSTAFLSVFGLASLLDVSRLWTLITPLDLWTPIPLLGTTTLRLPLALKAQFAFLLFPPAAFLAGIALRFTEEKPK